MKIDLSGKLAIVSGSTGGIGLGISQSLAEAGATVVVIGRDMAKVEQALASIREAVPRAQLRGLTADLGTAEGAEKLSPPNRARTFWSTTSASSTTSISSRLPTASGRASMKST